MKNTKKGFTLVELLVVIAILAILASVSVVGYSAFIGKAEEQQAKTEAAQIASAIQAAMITDDYVAITIKDTAEATGTTYYIVDTDNDGIVEFATGTTPTGTAGTIDSAAFENGRVSFESDNITLTYTNNKSGKKATVVVGEIISGS